MLASEAFCRALQPNNPRWAADGEGAAATGTAELSRSPRSPPVEAGRASLDLPSGAPSPAVLPPDVSPRSDAGANGLGGGEGPGQLFEGGRDVDARSMDLERSLHRMLRQPGYNAAAAEAKKGAQRGAARRYSLLEQTLVAAATDALASPLGGMPGTSGAPVSGGEHLDAAVDLPSPPPLRTNSAPGAPSFVPATSPAPGRSEVKVAPAPLLLPSVPLGLRAFKFHLEHAPPVHLEGVGLSATFHVSIETL